MPVKADPTFETEWCGYTNTDVAQLCVDDGYILSRRLLPAGQNSELFLIADGSTRRASSLDQLNNELRLTRDLDDPSVVRAVALGEYGGQPALRLEDPGGDPLSRAVPHTLSVESFLGKSIAIAAAVGRVHAQSLLHRALRPANIFMHQDGRVAITGFRQAARLGSATQVAALGFEPGADAMPYISPELTGRLDTPIDARSDLYSLGVILYEVMTGHRPFEASSPAEWVHAHIARKPTIPGHWAPHLPNMVAATVMKLLAKSPEERYQTAVGLVADLDRCLAEWKRHGRIEPFPLGGQDVREHLSVPSQLYGREREVAAIGDALNSVRRGGRSRFVFVSGQSGVGKTSLVEAALRTAPFREAIIAAGNFDQLNLDIPFATLARSFDAPLRNILAGGESIRLDWRNRLQLAVGPNGQLICDLIPALAILLGLQSPVPDMRAMEAQTHFRTTPPLEAQLRFRLALERFMAEFATPEHPLVLFLDNVQWIDRGTIDFLHRLMREAPSMALLVIAACRSDEVRDTPLADALAILRADGDDIVDVSLQPLDRSALARLIGDALGTAPSEAKEIADLVGHRTAGNPLFALQLLNTFVESGALAFNPSARGWRLDENRAAGSGIGDINDLVGARLARLPEEVRADLARFACLGNSADSSLIGAALGCPKSDVAERLSAAIGAGLIVSRRGSFAFVHDRVQEAAYDLVPAQGRPRAHLALGRQLLAALPSEERHTAVFEVAAQFNRGASLLVAADERERIAALHLEAGIRAASTAAHVTAIAYLDAGLSILGTGENGELEFELRFRRAESLFLSGDLAAARSGFAALAAGPLPGDRRARVATQQITLATAQAQNDEAIAFCLDYMRTVGHDWPAHPSIVRVRAEFAPIFEEILAERIEDRLGLPDLVDGPNATMLVLTATLPAAFLVDINLIALVLGRMVNQAREINCAASALAYTTIGYVLGPLFGDYAAGYRFGRVGMELVERPHLDHFRARATMTFAYHVHPYARPLHTARELHRRAYELAAKQDDVTYTGFSLCTLISNLLASGEALASVERQAEKMLAIMRRAKFGLIVDMLTSQLMLVRQLRGSTLSPLTFDDGDFDEAAFVADFEVRLESDRIFQMAACWHYIRKVQATVFAGDFRAAIAASERAEPLLWTSLVHLELVEYHLYTAIARAALAQDEPSYAAAVERHHAALEVFARNAPENWRHHADLVAAERARLSGSAIDALRLFESAIASARANGFHHIEALSHERAAMFCAEIGLAAMAEAHRERAHAAYCAWGADGKARAMAELYPALGKQSAGATGPVSSGVADIDLATVIRSSQAVTDEIAFGRLLPTLMRIALENACASRGLLLIPRRDGLWIEAESEVGADDISVTLRQSAPTVRDASLQLLAEVVRTQAPVVVGDAIFDPRLRNELSATLRQARSILALPLVRQGKLIGVLYLENDATPHAFTPGRLAVLRLLASQAAISLENAAREEKEQLLREVHHRVKNNLQLISSLLNLQSSRTSDPAVAELFAESRNRVRSMALVHENLYRAGAFARVAMGDHVRALCSHLVRAYGGAQHRLTLQVDVAEVELDLDRAIPCGLIINELVSNALKHAFPNGRAGTVRVELQAHGPGRYTLSVADDGIGLAAGAETGDTLGLQLVRDLADQLRGRIEVNNDHGTRFLIKFGVPSGNVE